MDKQNVFELLARYSGRANLSDAQKRELRKNVITDFVEFYYSRYRWTLIIIKWFHLATESRWFISFVHPAIKYYIKHHLRLNYQDVLNDYFNDINLTLNQTGINVHIGGINDIARWSNINAEYTSWFGTDQRISILSGTMYFSHLFSRSFQPLYVSIDSNHTHSAFQYYFRRMFQRSAIGFLTNNHRKGLSLMFLIPDDPSLLYGMEMFIICHEMGHAYFSQNGISAWPFEPLSNDTTNQIIADEEIGADLFAINTIWHYYLSHKENKQMLFGCCLFFLIFSWFEEDGLVSKPVSHPNSSVRYNYLMNFIRSNTPELFPQYLLYQHAAERFWYASRKTIKKEIEQYKKKKTIYKSELDQVEAFTRHYFVCQSEEE